MAVPARNSASSSAPANVATPASSRRVRLQPRTVKPWPRQDAARRAPPSSPRPRMPTAVASGCGGRAKLQRARRCSRGEHVQLAMVLEHQGQHELAHHPGERGVDQAAQGQVGQGRVGQHGVDAGTERQDQPQVGQGGQQARRCAPDQGRVDLGEIAGIGPDPDSRVPACGAAAPGARLAHPRPGCGTGAPSSGSPTHPCRRLVARLP